jgi:imidazolonepropionase-like amidohydrolase
VIRVCIAVLALVLGPAAIADDDVLLLRHARIIDASSSLAREGMSVVIQGGRIIRIDHDEQIPDDDYPDAETLDLTGKYLLPGLVETHAHLATMPQPAWVEAMLDRYLHSGVTTLRDMAGDTRYLSDLRRRLLIGDLQGPDLHYSALMAGPSFFDDPRTAAAAAGETPGEVAWMQSIEPTTDMTIAVARSRGTGATGIKIYANLPAAEVSRIGAEAAAQDIQLWSHGTIAPALPMDAVEAGVNVLSHACMLVSHISPLKPDAYPARPDPDFSVFGDDYAAYDDLFARMREHGTVLDANLRLYALADRQRAADPENPPRMRCPLDYAAGLVSAAHLAGIPITVGTDGVAPAQEEFPALFEEIELLHDEAGLSAHDVITAATHHGALALGLRDEIGLVAVGYRADLIILDADPLADIRNIREIDTVIRNGTLIPRAGWTVSPDLAPGE